MHCGIYKIINNIDNKIYVGQSANIEKRWNEHIRIANNPSYYGHKKSLLYPAIVQYGIENFSFEILEECPIDELDEKEIKWINYYNSNNLEKGYNILSGGQQGRQFDPQIFYDLWDEGKSIKEIHNQTKASYSTIENNLRGYKNYCPAESWKRGSLASEYRLSIINNNPVYQYDLFGNYITEYKSIKDASFSLFGDYKHMSITNAVQSVNHIAYGYLWSKEKVEKLKPYSPDKQKAVQCIETGQIFFSTREAARAYNMKSPSSIIACCKGKQKTAAKDLKTKKSLHWRYYTFE